MKAKGLNNNICYDTHVVKLQSQIKKNYDF